MKKEVILKPSILYSTMNLPSIFFELENLYNIGKIVNYEFIQRGNNDTYKITTTQRNYILRIYKHHSENQKKVDFEINALKYLEANNVLVSAPIARKDTNLITKVYAPEGIRYLIVTHIAEGKELKYKISNDAFIYGKAVAFMHKQSDSFKTDNFQQITIKQLLEESISIIKQYTIKFPIFNNFFNSFIDNFFIHFSVISLHKLDYGFCHGDLHGGNAHYNDNSLTLFDFDFSGFSWRAYDIAVFRWGCNLRPNGQELWDYYIKGYKTERELSEIDIHASKYFVIIRDLWIMALHIKNSYYFGNSLIGEHYLNKRLQFLKKLEIEYLKE